MARKLIALIAVSGITLFSLASLANAASYPGEGLKPVQVLSSQPFEETVKNLKKLVAKNGMMVLGEVNQGKIMSMAGFSMKAVSLLIGSPIVGKKLFSEDIGATVAAPFRVTIYQDKSGKTVISYYRPSQLLASFAGEKIGMVAKNIDEKLAMLTSMAGK